MTEKLVPPPLLPPPPRCRPPSADTIARTEVIDDSSRFSLAASSGAVILALSDRMALQPPGLTELFPNRGMEQTERCSVPSLRYFASTRSVWRAASRV